MTMVNVDLDPDDPHAINSLGNEEDPEILNN